MPAPLQLLQRGLFPCTPTAPSLAVDLNMLDFARNLFLRLPPNTTAWCETLEAFLGARRYKLTTRVRLSSEYQLILILIILKDTLRRRFGNSLQWYTSLVSVTEQHVQASIEAARLEHHAPPDPSEHGSRASSKLLIPFSKLSVFKSELCPTQIRTLLHHVNQYKSKVHQQRIEQDLANICESGVLSALVAVKCMILIRCMSYYSL